MKRISSYFYIFNSMVNKDILGKVAEDVGLPVDVVRKVYKAYWRFIKDSIEALPLRDNLSEEEFNKLKTNINVPSLGKFTCTFDRYQRVNKRYEYIRKVKDAENNKDLS